MEQENIWSVEGKEEEELLVPHPPVEGMMIFVKKITIEVNLPLLCVADVSSSTTAGGENIKRSLAQ